MTTTTKSRESIIDRVRKLLAVAAEGSGATIAEREQAQRRAAEMMTKHDLASYDLDDAERGGIEQDADTVADGMTETWRGELLGRIAQAMGGDWYYSRLSRTRRRFTIVGRPDTVAFARTLTEHLIPWLEIECDAALAKARAAGETGVCSRCDGVGETRRLVGGGYTAHEHTCPTCDGSGTVPLNARPFRRDFYDAASRKIAGRLAAQRRKTADETKGKGTGRELVRSDRSAIDRFYEQAGIKLRSSSSYATGGSAAGRAAGHDAGDRADLAPSSKITGRGRTLPAGAKS